MSQHRYKSTGERVAENIFGGLSRAVESIPESVRQSRDDEDRRKRVTFQALQDLERQELRRQEFNQGMERLKMNFLKTKFQIATSKFGIAKSRIAERERSDANEFFTEKYGESFGKARKGGATFGQALDVVRPEKSTGGMTDLQKQSEKRRIVKTQKQAILNEAYDAYLKTFDIDDIDLDDPNTAPQTMTLDLLKILARKFAQQGGKDAQGLFTGNLSTDLTFQRLLQKFNAVGKEQQGPPVDLNSLTPEQLRDITIEELYELERKANE